MLASVGCLGQGWRNLGAELWLHAMSTSLGCSLLAAVLLPSLVHIMLCHQTRSSVPELGPESAGRRPYNHCMGPGVLTTPQKAPAAIVACSALAG